MSKNLVTCSSADRTARRSLSLICPEQLSPNPNNPRKHTKVQVRAIAKSIQAFGFNAPVLIDRDRRIIAGHGRYEAALLLSLAQIPVIFLDHLTEAQAKAYALADNQLTDRSVWDDNLVAIQLKELSELVLDFDLEATGFESPEIDFRIQSLDGPDDTDQADDFSLHSGAAVTVPGDLWLLGSHRLYCGNALSSDALSTLMDDEMAAGVFCDPPFNVPINGHATGNGKTRHREFAMASGEMTEQEFTDFLTKSLTLICTHSSRGAVLYVCMDWRHMAALIAAGRTAKCDLINLCVWAKSNGGMGSLYRSRHELVFVFRNGPEAHQNNIQLGRFGRNRSNVWNFPGANSFARRGTDSAAHLHPTVKPVGLVADALLDTTARDEIVLDTFLGSGTTLLAAERTGRRCYGIEIDPIYVDTAIERWQRMSGKEAVHSQGQTFSALRLARRTAP